MTIFRALARIAPLLIVASALAEGDRFCMGGNIDQLSAQQMSACQREVQQVRAAAAHFHTPAWHFIVVCDENGWKDYAAFSSTPASTLENASADTDIALRTTFFRGSRLNNSVGDRVLAAEMTSILRQTAVEVAAR